MAKTPAKRQTAKVAAFSAEEGAEICTAIYPLAEPLLPADLYLLDVNWEREGAHWYLRLYIERAHEKLGFAVTLEECAAFSRLLDPVLEMAQAQRMLPIPEGCAYALEVSSPGLFRELKTARELAFYQGSPVRVEPVIALPGMGKTTPEIPTATPMHEGTVQGILGLLHPETDAVEVLSYGGDPQTVSLKDFKMTLNPNLDIRAIIAAAPEPVSADPADRLERILK